MFFRRVSLALIGLAAAAPAATVALWLFDEPVGAYPSTILEDASPGGHILALGRGARIAEGRFGRALEIAPPRPLSIRVRTAPDDSDASRILFGLKALPVPPGRVMPPLHWEIATFAAMSTSGEKHLRSPGFTNVSQSRLNLGAFDWTVEFWFRWDGASRGEGTVFEIGSGPRGENDRFTRLSWNPGKRAFRFAQGARSVEIPSGVPRTAWVHAAFVYAAAEKQIRHFLDGKAQAPAPFEVRALEPGEEAYLTIGRDARFDAPFAGALDELRVSDSAVYTGEFPPPGTFSAKVPQQALRKGPPLLFAREAAVYALGSRKHLFLDDALIAESKGFAFVPNPPVRREMVKENLRGHLSLIEDGDKLLRIYYRAKDDHLGVVASRDGVKWEDRGIALAETVGLGNVFLDPNAPPEQRWKYFSGIKRRSMYVFHSPDGWKFTRHETAALPFGAGSQSIVYYDDQRQLYVSHHRSDYGATKSGHTRRRFLLAETKELLGPWPFEPMTPEKTAGKAKQERIKSNIVDPWYLDNGPLSPSGLGVELPVAFATDEAIDPEGTDVYTTKVFKYPDAPDTYLAFPAIYFHYDSDGPVQRTTLGTEERKMGSGVVEVQLAVSRDGLRWKRYPRPAYVPIESGGADAIHMMFMTHGMVRRGNEIWQYAGGHAGNGTNYHSAYVKQPNSPLWRFVQRVDGFVAAEAAYSGGTMTTKPFTFEGKRLRLNADTGAAGFLQVGFVDERGTPVPGFGVDDCVYVNGDFLDKPVEWLGKGTDVSPLAGRTVRLVFRARGAKVYAMQFTGE